MFERVFVYVCVDMPDLFLAYKDTKCSNLLFLSEPHTSLAWPIPKQNRKITSLWFSRAVIVLPPWLPNCLFPPLIKYLWGFLLGEIYPFSSHPLYPRAMFPLSQNVYYKSLDLEQVRKVGPLALKCACACCEIAEAGCRSVFTVCLSEYI